MVCRVDKKMFDGVSKLPRAAASENSSQNVKETSLSTSRRNLKLIEQE